MSDSTKILILVSTVIIVCVLCAVGFKLVNEGKSSVNASTNNFNDMTSQYSEIDLLIYDGAMVQGSEVVNLINKVTDSNDTSYHHITIAVHTNANKTTGKTYKGPSNTYKETDKSKADYINPSGQFKGKVEKDNNGIINKITFTQE